MQFSKNSVCLSVCLSIIYLSIYLSIYGSTALCWTLSAFQFLNLYTVGRNRTATEERYFLRGPCRDVISRAVCDKLVSGVEFIGEWLSY
jgi:hypothetical protein